jgi:MAF protein
MEIPFTTAIADLDEMPHVGEDPLTHVRRLAEEKARTCARYAPFGGLILAADTIVVDNDEIIGKPENVEDARRILQKLRNRTHLVHTAITVAIPSRGTSMEELCSTQVRMRQYTEDEISAYIDSGDPLDKAGAYAIQNEAFHPVARMNGCLASVMGLPLCHFERTLRRLGFGTRHGVPYRCQDELAYTCPIFKRVLSGEEIG